MNLRFLFSQLLEEVSSILERISCIVLMRSALQVQHTVLSLAEMSNHQLIWNLPSSYHPCKSMDIDPTTIETNQSIPIFVTTPCPNNTAIIE